ncbi:hypothetical protein [Nitrososphaera sp.]|uniref:hypothetical protein n=1 Tax=Nitrososphaera sp. TaxID=1971748 RepID=UPI002ED9ED4F
MRKSSKDDNRKTKGGYTLKKLGQQEYLYHVYRAEGKVKWRIVGNVKDIDSKDPKLVKARALSVLPYARNVVERYMAGDIDKAKAKSELAGVIDRCL